MLSLSVGFIALLAAHGQAEAFHRYPAEHAEHDGIRITVTVEANVYTWLLENMDAAPITSIEMPQKNCYNQRLPLGWSWEYEDDYFRARTDDPANAIGPGRTGEFTTRVSSTGAVLGHVPIKVGFEGDAQLVVFEPLWGPVRKPISMVLLVALTIAGVAIMHMALLVWLSKRRRAKPALPA